MKHLAVVLITLLALSAPAFPQSKSKTVIQQETTQDFPDNSTGAITPAIVRSYLTDVINSYNQWPAVNLQATGPYTLLNTDMGALINVTSQSTFTLILPQAVTPFFNGWSTFVKNIGPVGATLSPQNSTIGGAATLALASGQGIFVVSDGANWQTWGGFGTGTVTSIGVAMPGGIFNVNGSPITTSGTITATIASENANTFWGGPSSGAAASPNFRALVSNDMPTPNTNAVGGIYSVNQITHQWINSINNSGTPQQSQPAVGDLAVVANNVVLGNVTGNSQPPGVIAMGRTADWNQDTVNTVMTTDQVRLSASPQWISIGSKTITPNFNLGMNFNTTILASNTCNPCTVVTPQNLTQPWSGSLIITNASQNATIAFSKPVWQFANGTAPVMSVSPNLVDVVNFFCVPTPSSICYSFYGTNYQ